MRKCGRFDLLLCAAIALVWAALIGAAGVGSAALAQQAQTSVRSWTGQIDWWISFPNGRHWGRLDLTFDYDGQGNLKGRMTGDNNFEGEFLEPCPLQTPALVSTTPSKLSANLVGQYTPGRNAMSLRVTDQKFEQGQFSMCAIGPGGGWQLLSGQPFGGGGPLYQPGLAQLLNSLTVKADGSVEASGEWPVAPAEAQSTLHMKLTLRRDCRDPEMSSGYFTRDPFGPETPADIAPSCESCPGGTWKLNLGEITFRSTERREPIADARAWGGTLCWFVAVTVFHQMVGCSGDIVTPQCVYTYEAIWTCSATGNVRKTTKTKVEDANCIRRG